MAHLVEEYAKNLGVKFSRPVLKDHFFPINFDKYITISLEKDNDSKVYPYFGMVINLLRPFLERAKIKVIQLGGKGAIEGVDEALNLSFKQNSFVISKSLVHIGADGVLNHLSSLKNIPTVTLFGNIFSQCNKPVFSKSGSSNINLSPDWNQKPCLSPVDPQRQINNIKPELIAQSIIDFLDIEKEDINFETKHIGNFFLTPSVEVVPTTYTPLQLAPNQVLSVRTDYGFDEDAFMQYCTNYKVDICASQLIQPHGLQKIARNVNNFYLFVDKEWDDIPESYFNTLKNLNINISFLVTDPEDLPSIRNKYFDITVSKYYEDKKAPCEISENTKFLSSLRVIEGGKEYLSYAHWKKGLDRNKDVLDTPDYWRQLNHFYIYESE